ncbi:DUF5995 family protein [Nocardia aurantia]|uniref:Uncharacterized protein n=1 Tax=Nocardia aurantia TaxID=2585199 RepID=A0A7K0E1J3_9NOCA|nr:DUF5995 family protein [Nocardia aurantia]MQY31960.1 hypothetical protein [Nocardia aurantia]
MLLSARSGYLLAISIIALVWGIVPMAAAQPRDRVPSAVCGSPLSDDELETVARLSDISDVTGDTLQRLDIAVERHHSITAILARHRDRRGLFGLGLDAVERAAVMPLQHAPTGFADRDYAHAISLELLRRYLGNLHAEFTGGSVEPHWERFFELASSCDISGARAAMAGYNAHLSVDLAYSVAAVRSVPGNAPDYAEIVAAIANAGDLIIDRTKQVYDADLGPLWHFYFVGEGLDLLAGKGVATRPLLVLADLGANVVIFGNGLALEDPALHDRTAAEIGALHAAADTAFTVLAQLHAL